MKRQLCMVCFLLFFLVGTVSIGFSQEAEGGIGSENVSPPSETSPPPAVVQPSQPQTPQQETRRSPTVTIAGEDRLLQAIQANPTDKNAYNRLLEYYRAQNRIQDHLKILIKAIQNVGGNLTYYLWMGDDYMELTDYSKAIISYQYALKEAPTNPVVYLKLGNAHLLLKNYYSAETALLASLYYGEKSGKINIPFAYRLLGECYEGVKNYLEALKWYQKAYRLSPSQEYKALVDRVQAQVTND
ncbi:MAG: tetratricopeptide repeat protein [Brevinematales bacterium]|nr:tetratricopeptide repeat protein [Brevinematales bacterium]